MFLLILTLYLAQIIATTPNHTSAERVGWESSPNGCRTSDILWSCLLTLLACSWTVLHLNIPARTDGWLRKTFRKLSWMLVAIIAPEYITAQAFGQWLRARISIAQMETHKDITWTTAHGFYVDMGAFQLRIDDGDLFRLSLNEFIWCLKQSCLGGQDITVTKEEIDDRSKASLFTKGVTCSQSLWLVLQCITRIAQQLQVSQLELATCAYVACAVVAWLFWREKPLDVDQPCFIGPIMKVEVFKQMCEDLQIDEEARLWRRKRAAPEVYWNTSIGTGMFLCGAGVIFCSIHCAAWNYEFPTSRETYLWRVFAAAATGSAILMLILQVADSDIIKIEWLHWHKDQFSDLLLWLLFLWMLLYLAARFYLIFAMFYALRSMPVGVYETVDWTKYIPHWG